MSEPWGVACHMGSHSITCHPTQANTLRLNTSHLRLVLDLSTPEGWKAEMTYWLATYRDGLPAQNYWHQQLLRMQYLVFVPQVFSFLDVKLKIWKYFCILITLLKTGSTNAHSHQMQVTNYMAICHTVGNIYVIVLGRWGIC